VLPSTPYDAKGLLTASIRDDDPVVFIESGMLYRTKGPVPEEDYIIPIGQCDVKRKGDDLTIVAVSRVVNEALVAARKLEEQGLTVEVIDLRSIQPLDLATILESVKKTGRLIVASDDVKSGGIGSEIAAAIVEEAFDSLDAPIVRVASPSMPIPFSPTLEQTYMPSSEKIVEAAKRLIG
jgi:pyruvate dehydrogenase E1 component beta subunit